MSLGLTQSQKLLLDRLIHRRIPDAQIFVFGSRAKETQSSRSDIDIVLKTKESDRHLLATLIDDIQESELPFLCDILYHSQIQNPSLLEHIHHHGKPLLSA